MKKKAIVRQAEEAPVSAAVAKQRSLQLAMLDGVSPEDMTEIVAVQVRKAKDGDSEAARFITDARQFIAKQVEKAKEGDSKAARLIVAIAAALGVDCTAFTTPPANRRAHPSHAKPKQTSAGKRKKK